MTVLIIGLCAALVVIFSQEAMSAAAMAAQTFALGVLPALFPMMVLGRLLPPGGKVWQTAAFSFLSGSPASAQRAAQTVQCHHPESLFALTGVMSPMFFTGTLAGWTGDRRAAWTMLLLHWLSAAVTAAVWRMFEQPSPVRAAQDSAKASLPSAISQSAVSLLGVCGAMMLFSIAAGVGRAAAGFFPVQSERFLSLLHAALEIGSGAHAMIETWEQPPFALLGAMCSFGGLSIWLQNLLFADKSIRPARLLFMRMLHGAVCYGLGRLIFP